MTDLSGLSIEGDSEINFFSELTRKIEEQKNFLEELALQNVLNKINCPISVGNKADDVFVQDCKECGIEPKDYDGNIIKTRLENALEIKDWLDENNFKIINCSEVSFHCLNDIFKTTVTPKFEVFNNGELLFIYTYKNPLFQKIKHI